MKRRNEYLICKRDGRRQHLRASKLARSIDRAFDGAAPTPWFAVEAAAAVLGGLRSVAGGMPTTRELATAVVGWLTEHGHAVPARRYAERGARARQRAELIASRAPVAFAPRIPVGGGGAVDPRLN